MIATSTFKLRWLCLWWMAFLICNCSEGLASRPEAGKNEPLYGPLVTAPCTWVAGQDSIYCVTKERTLREPLKGQGNAVILDTILGKDGDLLAMTSNERVIQLHYDGHSIQSTDLLPLAGQQIMLNGLIGYSHGLWLEVDDHEIGHMRENGQWEIMAFPDYKGLGETRVGRSRPTVLYTDQLGDALYMVLRYKRDVSVYAILNPETLQWEIPTYEGKYVPPPLAIWNDKVIRLDSSFDALAVTMRIHRNPKGNLSQRNLYYQVTPDRFLSQESVPLPHASWQKVVYLDVRERKLLSECQTESLSAVRVYPREHGVRIWNSGISCCHPLENFLLSTGNLWQIQLPSSSANGAE